MLKKARDQQPVKRGQPQLHTVKHKSCCWEAWKKSERATSWFCKISGLSQVELEEPMWESVEW